MKTIEMKNEVGGILQLLSVTHVYDNQRKNENITNLYEILTHSQLMKITLKVKICFYCHKIKQQQSLQSPTSKQWH